VGSFGKEIVLFYRFDLWPVHVKINLVVNKERLNHTLFMECTKSSTLAANKQDFSRNSEFSGSKNISCCITVVSNSFLFRFFVSIFIGARNLLSQLENFSFKIEFLPRFSSEL
jgi:hypothetical protein